MKNCCREKARKWFEEHATAVSSPSEERQRYNQRVWRIVDDYNRVIETATRRAGNSKLKFCEAVDY